MTRPSSRARTDHPPRTGRGFRTSRPSPFRHTQVEYQEQQALIAKRQAQQRAEGGGGAVGSGDDEVDQAPVPKRENNTRFV